MSSKQVAEYFSISVSIVHRYAKQGRLKGFKLGATKFSRNNTRRHWRFRKEDVEKFAGGV